MGGTVNNVIHNIFPPFVGLVFLISRNSFRNPLDFIFLFSLLKRPLFWPPFFLSLPITHRPIPSLVARIISRLLLNYFFCMLSFFIWLSWKRVFAHITLQFDLKNKHCCITQTSLVFLRRKWKEYSNRFVRTFSKRLSLVVSDQFFVLFINWN